MTAVKRYDPRRPRITTSLAEQIDEWRGGMPFDPAVRDLLALGLAYAQGHLPGGAPSPPIGRREVEEPRVPREEKPVEPKPPPKIAPRHWAQ